MHALPQVSAGEIAAANSEIDSAPPLGTIGRSGAEARGLVFDVSMRLKTDAGPICAQAGANACAINVIYETDSQVNAWASGERDVTITSALMRYLTNEDEVAAVVAHEMAHHIAGHIDKGTTNQIGGAAIGGILLGAVVALAGGDQAAVQEAAQLGMQGGAKIGGLSFSKEHEREADYLGAYLMARAGFDVERGGEVWVRLAKQPDSNRETDLFDTHPAGADRLAAWALTIEEIENSPDLMPHWGE